MWIAILGIVDKVLGIFDQLTGFFIKRSDASKQIRDKAQADMQEAVKKGDLDAYWNARSRKRRA